MKIFAKLVPLGLLLLPLSVGAVSIYGDTSVQVNTTVGATTTVETGVSGSARVETPSGVNVDVNRSGDDGVEVTIENKSIGDPDFDLLVSTIKTENERVVAVDVDADGAVDVAYKHQGRLFGFIPVTVTSHTTITATTDGTVTAKVRLPWWSFFVSGVSKIKTDT
ncbi:MAG: hypothetical protein Q7R74_01630, partial [bacterium]|nr:hypothetical protein [bacterium]